MKFYIASDHAGRSIKERMRKTLEKLKIEYEDLKIILKPLSIKEMKIDDDFFKLPNYIIKSSPTMGG